MSVASIVSLSHIHIDILIIEMFLLFIFLLISNRDIAPGSAFIILCRWPKYPFRFGRKIVAASVVTGRERTLKPDKFRCCFQNIEDPNAVAGRALGYNVCAHWAQNRMGPFEGGVGISVILDNICMRSQDLVISEKMLQRLSIVDEVVEPEFVEEPEGQ
jgi:hypothetical protein